MSDVVTVAEVVEPPDDLDKMLGALRAGPFNGKAGNKALRDALGWTDEIDRYWSAHGRALDAGIIIPGKGKGGSVRLSVLEVIDASTNDIARAVPEPINNIDPQPKEASLYDPAREVISQSWAKAENYDNYIASITAARGSAKTGGKWTRPDISLLAVKAFPYLPTRLFEIVTFEIKPDGQTNVEAVFEALSHQQFATRSYAVYVIQDTQIAEDFTEKHPEAARILGIARQHGVGVIVTSKIGDWETWDELVAARRVTPDPEQANRFIATCFQEKDREQVIKWHK